MDTRKQPPTLHPAAAGRLKDKGVIGSLGEVTTCSIPKLGDFSKLLLHAAPCHPKQTYYHSNEGRRSHLIVPNHVRLGDTDNDDNSHSDSPSKLGNFSRVFTHFDSATPKASSDVQIAKQTSFPLPITQPDSNSQRRPSGNHAQAISALDPFLRPASLLNVLANEAKPKSEHASDTSRSALSDTESAAELEIPDFTPATTPSSSLGKQTGYSSDAASYPSTQDVTSGPQNLTPRALFEWSAPRRKKSSPPVPAGDVTTPSKRASRGPFSRRSVPALSYQLTPNGPVKQIENSGRSTEEKHQSLTASLVSHFVDDAVTGSLYPEVQRNGIHVFLDLSNIQISLHYALKNKYSLDPNARFVPLPRLNMEFLKEILVRQRHVRVLNAGCSMRPDRSEPCFISELRQLHYHVDVRERIRADGAKSPGPVQSKRTSTPEDVRYVEDLVDETLQIRIGESVMEYFQEQGTIVLATGDAKPAKYSDGFFAYAERALKMGWNVEVVSWNLSLSSAWKDPKWTDRWGQRFRLIELDEFLDNLWIL